MKARAILEWLFVVLSATSCAAQPPDVPMQIKGLVVTADDGKPLTQAKVSLDIRKKGDPNDKSVLGHTVKSRWATHVVETDENGTFIFDLRAYHDVDKLHAHLTVASVLFEKDGYESQVKVAGEQWEHTALRRRAKQ